MVEAFVLRATAGMQNWSSNSPSGKRVYTVKVENAKKFVTYCMVTIDVQYKDSLHKRYFRILNSEKNSTGHWITLRYENFNDYLKPQFDEVAVPAWSLIQTTQGTNVYGSTDWVIGAMQANESHDLMRPSSWTFLNENVGNPITVYSKEIRQIFDIAFRADSHVMKDLAGANFPNLDRARALDAGFGSLYWMEGVVTRARDMHGGNGKLLIIARVNNDLLCNLAAVVELDDTSGLDARFLRYTSVRV